MVLFVVHEERREITAFPITFGINRIINPTRDLLSTYVGNTLDFTTSDRCRLFQVTSLFPCSDIFNFYGPSIEDVQEDTITQ